MATRLHIDPLHRPARRRRGVPSCLAGEVPQLPAAGLAALPLALLLVTSCGSGLDLAAYPIPGVEDELVENANNASNISLCTLDESQFCDCIDDNIGMKWCISSINGERWTECDCTICQPPKNVADSCNVNYANQEKFQTFVENLDQIGASNIENLQAEAIVKLSRKDELFLEVQGDTPAKIRLRKDVSGNIDLPSLAVDKVVTVLTCTAPEEVTASRPFGTIAVSSGKNLAVLFGNIHEAGCGSFLPTRVRDTEATCPPLCQKDSGNYSPCCTAASRSVQIEVFGSIIALSSGEAKEIASSEGIPYLIGAANLLDQECHRRCALAGEAWPRLTREIHLVAIGPLP